MAEDRVEPREASWRQLLPWTELFRGFKVALDLNKLLLAAAGIVTMSFGWWLLSVIFTANEDKAPPDWQSTAYKAKAEERGEEAWVTFRRDRDRWNLLHRAANLNRDVPPRWEVKDFAETVAEYETFKDFKPPEGTQRDRAEDAFLELVNEKQKEKLITEDDARLYRAKAAQYAQVGRVKPAGTLTVGPWFEDRGPNPYLLSTGQTGIPWEPGHFWDWFVRDQVLVMTEPLVKLVRPLIYFFSPRGNSFGTRLYFLSVMLWTVLTWSVFGGAITRIAAVQVARGEKIGLTEALRFTLKRLASYVTAPLFPLVFVLVILIGMAIFGVLHMIPFVGDILVSGLFWPLMLVCGLVMAVALVGLVSWPMMSAAISAEGTDSWEAVSRSYSYLLQRPWHFAWYSLVAIAYGAVVVFFVGFMGSLTVYLAKWGVAQPAVIVGAESREPSFLFIYAPTSFGWRELLLEGASVKETGANVVEDRGSRLSPQGAGAGGVNRWNRINPGAYDKYVAERPGWQKFAAWLVAFWLGLFFLLILGFGYSYFWTASTIIYLLLRRNVEAAELDEVYLEEDDQEGAWGGPLSPAAPAAPEEAIKPGGQALPLVQPPAPPPLAPVAPSPLAPTPAAGSPTAPDAAGTPADQRPAVGDGTTNPPS